MPVNDIKAILLWCAVFNYAIHYAGFAFYKLGIILFNVAPLVVLFLVY